MNTGTICLLKLEKLKWQQNAENLWKAMAWKVTQNLYAHTQRWGNATTAMQQTQKVKQY